MKVAILGTGPSAAYAALACDSYEVESHIISKQSPSIFYPGAFWPRSNPTEMELPLSTIYISKVGTAENYLRKQWGEVRPYWLDETSFPSESSFEYGFNPYEFFGAIWKDRDIHLSQELTDDAVSAISDEYDLVFMTFPTEKSKKALDSNLIKYPIVSYKSNLIGNSYCVYDGETHDKIVRISNLFGFVHNEYGKNYIPSMELVGSGQITWVRDMPPDTPEWDPEDTPADNVYLLGRFAQWSRKVLSHNAFENVTDILNGTL